MIQTVENFHPISKIGETKSAGSRASCAMNGSWASPKLGVGDGLAGFGPPQTPKQWDKQTAGTLFISNKQVQKANHDFTSGIVALRTKLLESQST